MKALLSLLSKGFDGVFNWLSGYWQSIATMGAKWWGLAIGLWAVVMAVVVNGTSAVQGAADSLAQMLVPHIDFSIWQQITEYTSVANTLFPLQESMGLLVAYLLIRITLAFSRMSIRLMWWLGKTVFSAMRWGS